MSGDFRVFNPSVTAEQRALLDDAAQWRKRAERSEAELATCETDRDRYARDANKLERLLRDMCLGHDDGCGCEACQTVFSRPV